jgi:heme exporter protein A
MPITEPLPPPALFEARGLSFARGEEPIFGPLDLSLDSGATLVIEGGNGAGKTTLIRVLAGVLEPSAGELLWQGRSITTDPRPAGAIAVLGHALGLKLELSARENLAYRLALHGLKPGLTIETALKSVALEGYEDIAVRSLSAGQRKRVALAGLLLTSSTLWLLDEPYANLDRPGQVLVNRMLETHCLRGGAALLTSHGLIQPEVSNYRTMTLGAPA